MSVSRSVESYSGSINISSVDERDPFFPITNGNGIVESDSPRENSFKNSKSSLGKRYQKESPSIEEDDLNFEMYPISNSVTKLPIKETTHVIGSAPKHYSSSLPRDILRSPSKNLSDLPTPPTSGSFRNLFSNVAQKEKKLLWDDIQEEATESNSPLPFKVVSTNTPREKIDISHQSLNLDQFSYRHPNFVSELLISRYEDVLTVGNAWNRSVANFGPNKCLGHRKLVNQTGRNSTIWTSVYEESDSELSKEYSWFTYNQIGTQVRALVTSLLALECPNGQYIIWSENRPEWIVTSLALSQIKDKISVPLLPNLTNEVASSIINHSEAHTIFCSSAILDKVLLFFTEIPKIQRIYHFDELTEYQANIINSKKSIFKDVSIISLRHLWTLGSEKLNLYSKREKQSPEDICTIYYTPGSEEEEPKGVLFSNTNIISAASGLHTALNLKGDQIFLSQHPFAISTERCLAQVMLDNGSCIGFSYNSKLENELQSLSPTIMNVSPDCARELQLIIQRKILNKNKIDKFLLQSIFSTPHVLHSQNAFSIVWDFFLNRRIRSVLGGNLQMILSIGYGLSESIQFFLQHALNIPILQGYGLTETFGVGCLQIYGNDDTGIVGAPLPCIEIRLRSSPKLGYYVTDSDPSGEVLIRGPSVTLGYFKNQELNKKKFQNGYFCTGDIARLNQNGSFSILERKQDFLQVGDRHRIGVSGLERAFEEHSLISRIWISDSETHKHLIAITYITPYNLQKFGKRLGILIDDVNSKDLQRALLQELSTFAERKGLPSFSFIKNIRIINKPFEELNPSMIGGNNRFIRKKMKRYFADEIEEMLAEIEI